MMARLLFGTLDPFQWMLLGGLDVTRSTDDWQVETVERAGRADDGAPRR